MRLLTFVTSAENKDFEPITGFKLIYKPCRTMVYRL